MCIVVESQYIQQVLLTGQILYFESLPLTVRVNPVCDKSMCKIQAWQTQNHPKTAGRALTFKSDALSQKLLAVNVIV